MNLGTMLTTLYSRLGYASSPAAAVTTRLTGYLNEVQQELLSEPGMARWLARNEPPLTFATVASQPVYGLPLVRIDAITDRTNLRKLQAASLDWYRTVEPSPTTVTGLPQVWIPLGTIAVAMQPSAATGLWAASSSASDTSQTISVETVRTGNLPSVEAAVTLTGTTRVQINSLTDHLQVTKIYLSAACAGAVTLYDASTGGNALAVIPIGQTESRYLGIALWETPAQALTYTVDGERAMRDLSASTEEPPFPASFHRIYLDGATAKEYQFKDDSRASQFLQRYIRDLNQIRYALTCPPDYLPVSGGGAPDESSRYGAWYPPMRY